MTGNKSRNQLTKSIESLSPLGSDWLDPGPSLEFSPESLHPLKERFGSPSLRLLGGLPLSGAKTRVSECLCTKCWSCLRSQEAEASSSVAMFPRFVLCPLTCMNEMSKPISWVSCSFIIRRSLMIWLFVLGFHVPFTMFNAYCESLQIVIGPLLMYQSAFAISYFGLGK